MATTVWGVVKDGVVVPEEQLPEGLCRVPRYAELNQDLLANHEQSGR